MQFTKFKNSPYKLYSNYKPSGDQPNAIYNLVEGLNDGLSYQTLLGVTGSGKTYTMANIIAKTGRPAIIMAHNKTLAAQLYAEMREFFPENNVEYFVSYYDYYQPEAYVPSRDLFIEKDSSINEHIEQMRLSATRSLILKKDVIIVATVSAIYGIGNPNEYSKMVLFVEENQKISQKDIIKKLTQMQYERNNFEFNRSHFRVRGELIDIYPAENSSKALRIHNFDDNIEKLEIFDPLTGQILQRINKYSVFPANHYVTTRDTVIKACEKIKQELKERIDFFNKKDKLVEANRIEKRTKFDLEMLHEIGHCKGIENYSRHISNFTAGNAPPTLIDYLPDNTIMFIDESHVTIPQISSMYKGDLSRKQNLIDFGFRLPSAKDNRPLKFEEFENKMPQTIFVSATPAEYEIKHSSKIVEQVVRPTGLLDPKIIVKPAKNQVDDLLEEIILRTKKNEKILVTTLTKKMAEQLTEYYSELGIKIKYLHSDIDTIERVEIIKDLRQGVFDVLVGINLLREGLDIPEVSLIAILDADKEGFLRSHRSLIQTIGRVARNINGLSILYADKITNSMKLAIDETKRRREKQQKFNKKNNITPKQIIKDVKDIIDGVYHENNNNYQNKLNNKNFKSENDLLKEINKLEKEMKSAAKNLNFEDAAKIRDKIKFLKENILFG